MDAEHASTACSTRCCNTGYWAKGLYCTHILTINSLSPGPSLLVAYFAKYATALDAGPDPFAG